MAEEQKAAIDVLKDVLREIATGGGLTVPSPTERMRAALSLAVLAGTLHRSTDIRRIINGGEDRPS